MIPPPLRSTLFPYTTLFRSDSDWIERNMSILQKMGIGIESFGPNSFKIDRLPRFLDVSDPTQFMGKVIDDLKSVTNNSSVMGLGEEMSGQTVLRGGVEANGRVRWIEDEK